MVFEFCKSTRLSHVFSTFTKEGRYFKFTGETLVEQQTRHATLYLKIKDRLSRKSWRFSSSLINLTCGAASNAPVRMILLAGKKGSSELQQLCSNNVVTWSEKHAQGMRQPKEPKQENPVFYVKDALQIAFSCLNLPSVQEIPFTFPYI
jgi:hypothetical protein